MVVESYFLTNDDARFSQRTVNGSWGYPTLFALARFQRGICLSCCLLRNFHCNLVLSLLFLFLLFAFDSHQATRSSREATERIRILAMFFGCMTLTLPYNVALCDPVASEIIRDGDLWRVESKESNNITTSATRPIATPSMGPQWMYYH